MPEERPDEMPKTGNARIRKVIVEEYEEYEDLDEEREDARDEAAASEKAAPRKAARDEAAASEKAAPRKAARDEAAASEKAAPRKAARDEAAASEKAAPRKAARDEAAASEKAAPGKAVRDEAAPRGRRDPVLLVAAGLAVVAGVAAAWTGWSYHAKATDPGRAYARERDRVLAVAGQEIVNLNTLDYRYIAAGLRLWQDSTTADLYDQIVQGRDQLTSDVQKTKTVSTAKILESGLTELDVHAGKARVLAAVQITVTGSDGRPSPRISRLVGQLTKTGSGWKLSALGQAATSSASS